MFREGQIPQYQSHKKVWALKIANIEPCEQDGVYALVFEDPSYGKREVSKRWIEARQAAAGGYWVRYEDGYESWSPAEAFESGHTLIK